MYKGPLIDTDVHHRWRSDAELLQYVPKKWRDFIALPGGRSLPLFPGGGSHIIPHGVFTRVDAWSAEGAPPGSDYKTMRTQLLDEYSVAAAILSFDIGQEAAIFNSDLATAIVRAANDWSIDQWLNGDDPRLYGAILVPTQQPDEAAAEIRRVGSHPRMVEVLMVVNGLGKPFGHPLYHPIYEAAAEFGLPIAIHIAGEGLVPGSQMNASGIQATRFEKHSIYMQGVQNHISSFISQGVFEKYPGLKLILLEAGVAWVPWLMWELDGQFASLRQESRWVKKLPSEYFREHVRLSTQPLELSPERSQMIDLLEAFGGMDDVLCFSSDYPHWDFDNPTYISGRFPTGWLQKIFYENAAQLYPWPAGLPTPIEKGASVAAARPDAVNLSPVTASAHDSVVEERLGD
jgi:predicted TIM-barrel fold metal-dependent hydrolase